MRSFFGTTLTTESPFTPRTLNIKLPSYPFENTPDGGGSKKKVHESVQNDSRYSYCDSGVAGESRRKGEFFTG